MDSQPLHFIGEQIEVEFDTPPVREKTPPCPDRFRWDGKTYHITAKLAEWTDFSRRGRMARNMQPQHAEVAAGRGSLGVGRFYFRVRTNSGQIFDLYYDRAIKDASHRKGDWYIFRELSSKEAKWV